MIDGVTLTPLRQIPDERGMVMHMLRRTDPHFREFGEVYFSAVGHGAVKAWKRHRMMTLNLACVHGAVRLVIYDDRPESPTCGQIQDITLSPQTPGQYALVTVPPLLWTGFTGVAPGESLLCNCASLPHDPAEADRRDENDPAFPKVWPEPGASVRLSRSSIAGSDIAAVGDTLQRAYLGMGKETEAFEQELSAYFGGREAMCVSTGTAALHLALQAIGVGPGDEVLVPTLTYVASFQAVSATGATPVACDVRAEDGWIDVADAARRITPRTRAIMPVHYASGSGGLAEVYALAKQHGLRVIEDAAHAFGCTLREARIGSFGDIVCFSFDGIKNITSGEGGAVVTADAGVAERVKSARLLGVLKDTETRYAGKRSWDFDVTAQGWRYHMSNINAALGRAQLHRLDITFAPRRVHLARRYVERLAGMPDVRLLPLDYGPVVPHIFAVLISGGKRDAVREALRVVNIESGIHYKPNHLLSYYGGGATPLPVAEQLYAELLSLPLHAELTEDEQDRVLAVLEQTLR